VKRALLALIALVAAGLPVAAGAATGAPRAGSGHAAGARSSCPPMPRRAPAGYTIAVSDSFSKPSLNTRLWFRWQGQPGGDPHGWWKTPRKVASGGTLDLAGTWVRTGGNPSWTAGGEVTSGIGSRHLQTFGAYQWCMRSDAMAGTETDVLLWPSSNRRWPPEIDLYESSGDATTYATTLHYGTPKQDYVEQYQVSGHDATQWHVYTAYWKRGLVTVFEDGTLVSVIEDPRNVPSIPMRLDIQTQSIVADPVLGATTLDWVVEYAVKP